MPPLSKQVSDTLVEVERLYSTGLERHGATPQSVGWRDESSQRLRFAKLSQLLSDPPAAPVTVNDLGCGYGLLFSFLDEMAGVNLGSYYGYDISVPMLERARQATDARAQFVHSSEPTHLADYSFVSGTFNVKGACTEAAWDAHVRASVLALAERSRIGFAFNLLSTYVDFRQDNLFYADPCAFFEFCKREISPAVTLVHDYPLYEWTILVRHGTGPPRRPHGAPADDHEGA